MAVKIFNKLNNGGLEMIESNSNSLDRMNICNNSDFIFLDAYQDKVPQGYTDKNDHELLIVDMHSFNHGFK